MVFSAPAMLTVRISYILRTVSIPIALWAARETAVRRRQTYAREFRPFLAACEKRALRADLTPANANVGGKEQKIGGTSHVYALEERQQI